MKLTHLKNNVTYFVFGNSVNNDPEHSGAENGDELFKTGVLMMGDRCELEEALDCNKVSVLRSSSGEFFTLKWYRLKSDSLRCFFFEQNMHQYLLMTLC